MNAVFAVHMLNEQGKQKAKEIAEGFDGLLTKLEGLCAGSAAPSTREFSIVKTKLEEACFFAKKAMAVHAENQQP